MLKDITIGQYYNVDSPMHRMDARMKIILTVVFIVSIFMCKSFPALGLMVLFTLAVNIISKVPLKMVAKSLKPIVIIVIFVIVITSVIIIIFAFIIIW